MRTKNSEKLNEIKRFVESYCNRFGYGPSVREIADGVKMSKTNTLSYLSELYMKGEIKKGKVNYESLHMTIPDGVIRVPYVKAVSELEETAVDNGEAVTLPREYTGDGDFFIITPGSYPLFGIEENDNVLVKRTESPENGKIAVYAFNDTFVLKRAVEEPTELKILGTAEKLLRKLN